MSPTGQCRACAVARRLSVLIPRLVQPNDIDVGQITDKLISPGWPAA